MRITSLTLASLMAFSVSSPAIAASDLKKDPFTAGFEAYAKENPELAKAIQSYTKDIEKAVQAKPSLVETKEELGHNNS
ncbi:MAG: hypothetical protein JXR44_08895 [Thiotrichales bacterium]|nr:hypothetical protein [Thiotrichales bacterium]